MSTFAGIFPILVTPFHEDGSIDLTSQLRLVDHVLDRGAHGVGLFGTASEGYTLSFDERLTLLQRIVRQVNGRVPVVVSTGHTGTDVAVSLSKQAEAEGADAVMALPPYLMKPDADGMLVYFDAINRAVNIPIMIQDAPLLTQVSISPSLIARLADAFEHVAYAKVEAPPTPTKVTEILASDGETPIIFGGLNGQFLLEELGRGARGSMPGSDLVPEFVAIWSALVAGDSRRARAEFRSLLPLIRYELQPGLGVSAMKHNLVAQGIIENARVRHPTRFLDSTGVAELQTLLGDRESSDSLL